MAMKKLIILTLGCALLVGPAFAQSENPVAIFKSLDGNGDEKLSMSEAQSRVPELTLQMYDDADGNNDGQLSQDEFVFALRAYDKAKAEGRIR
jgi:hypothetical protein